MSWVAAGVTAATGIAKITQGVIQKRKAKKLKQSSYVSPELKKAEAEAGLLANSATYTGQAADEANVRQTTSQSISNASKVAGGANELLNYASAAQGNENRSMREIAKRALLWKDQQKANRNMIRGKIAGQQNENRRQFQATKSALIGASNENLYGGLTDVAGAAFYGGINAPNKKMSLRDQPLGGSY